MNDHPATPYAGLSPDLVLDAVESLGLPADGHLLALNSYENRVYQIGLDEAPPVVAKFYRPNRWSDAEILEEHAFTLELADLEIPAIPPMVIGGQTLHRFAIEKARKDADRDPAFQERNWTRIREGLDRMQRSLDPKADRALMRYALTDVARLSEGQRIEPLDRAAGLKSGMSDDEAARAIDAFLDRILAGTKLYDKTARLAHFGRSEAELAAANDSLLALAAALYPLQEANRDRTKERAGALYRLGPRYADVLLARAGGLVSPDANGTLRVTYGTVKGVQPQDGIFWLPQTTLRGIQQKNTGKGEFDAPRAELEAIRALRADLRAGRTNPYVDPKLKDVPVNFLSTVDTTGGNSGSATLNGKGELVGLLFDGTYDTVASDYLYDKVKTRSIHVDTRYMLWVLTEVDHATELLTELGFPPAK